MKAIRSLLIANRSEISIRVMRAAAEMGIRTVSIYSSEDRFALHRFKADESYLVGEGKKPLAAYLDIVDIIRIARQARVDAIHPGYGFLSENPEFARACAAAGIVFVGPTPEVMTYQAGERSSLVGERGARARWRGERDPDRTTWLRRPLDRRGDWSEIASAPPNDRARSPERDQPVARERRGRSRERRDGGVRRRDGPSRKLGGQARFTRDPGSGMRRRSQRLPQRERQRERGDRSKRPLDPSARAAIW